MYGLPRLSVARNAVSDYTTLARTRLNELKVVLSYLKLTFIHLHFILGFHFVLQDFSDSPSTQNADVSKNYAAGL